VRGMLLEYLKRLGWLDGLTAVLVIAGVVLAALKSVLGGSVLIVAALVVTQLAPRVLEWVRKQREQIEEEAKLLRIRRPISEVDPFEEGLVFQSALAQRGHEGREPPYVHRRDYDRDYDSILREALETEQFVLVRGVSTAGKSRTAFEAARSMRPEPTLLVPESPGALLKLLDLGLPVDRSRPSVLWLDDLDLYLEQSGMSRTLCDDLGKNGSRVVVLATMTGTARDRLRRGEGQIGKSAREMLNLFETSEITLTNEISSWEREEAESLYPDQRFVAGIGEHFAAARELLDEFKDAFEVHRHGFAVVVAALDWRRAGMSRPITEAELRELYALCLESFFPLLAANDEDYRDGVAWARHPLDIRAALLMSATEEGVEGFEIFDYVRDWSDATGGDFHPRLRAVPPPTWRFVVNRAGYEEAFVVGSAAYLRENLDAAEDALAKAANSDDPEVAPSAAFNLGVLLAEQGEHERAEQAFQQAVDSGHPEAAPMAANNLGFLLAEQGEHERAEQAYQRAIDSVHTDGAPMAAFNLGVLLAEQGEYDRAKEAYQQAVDSGHPEAAPMAELGLRRLYSSGSEEGG